MFDLFHLDENIKNQLQGTKPYLNMSWSYLYNQDQDYADEFMKYPEKEIKILSKSVSGYSHRYMEFQINDLPVKNKISELGSIHATSLIEVRGVVVMRGEKKIRPVILAFDCPKCGNTVKIEQTRQWVVRPEACDGCDNKRNFLKNLSETTYEDFQWIEIQENTSDTKNGKPPAKIRVALKNHRVDSCLPGENIVVIGIYKSIEDKPNSFNLEMDRYIDAVTLINSTEDATITLTDEDISDVKQIMKSDNHLENMRQSIAPSIYGLDTVKEALALQLCEGQVRNINNSRRRGQFHILMAGSPGCGKSELGDFMTKCHPKGRKAIGRGSSGVGLTAAVVKEGDSFVLKAGAMPLADNGFLFVDEIEKMSRQDSGAMHPGMEQQTIRIDKADISAELSTRCSILAACNPVDGVWNDYKTVKGNLNDGGKGMSLTLLDRFALVFIMKQNLETSEEENVINHIMNVNSESSEVQPPYTVETLRKIFAYARGLDVTVTKEVTKRLTEFYMVLYEASKIDNTLIITRRQPNDLLRLAEASARLNGRTRTELDDANTAIRLVSESLKEYGLDMNTGKIDQNAIYGKTLNKSAMIKTIPDIITRIASRNIDKSRVSRVDFIQSSSSTWRISEVEAGDLLEVALRDGLVYCPSPGYVAVTS